jgi:hypothetical protein
MSDRLFPPPDTKKAGETALELLKQLIALSSGVLALSATFIDKLRPSHWALLTLLAGSWIALIIAVAAGIQAMSATVKAFHRPEFSFTEEKLRRYARTSKYSFLAGITLFALFAFLSLATPKKTAPTNESRNPQKHATPQPVD